MMKYQDLTTKYHHLTMKYHHLTTKRVHLPNVDIFDTNPPSYILILITMLTLLIVMVCVLFTHLYAITKLSTCLETSGRLRHLKLAPRNPAASACARLVGDGRHAIMYVGTGGWVMIVNVAQ